MFLELSVLVSLIELVLWEPVLFVVVELEVLLRFPAILLNSAWLTVNAEAPEKKDIVQGVKSSIRAAMG